MKKLILRSLLIVGVIIAIALVGVGLWIKDRYVVPIITYHHIGPCMDPVLALNTVSTESFEYQMAFLKTRGYQVIAFDELVEGIKQNRKFARNTVVIHFDDGYDNNYTNAFPILKKYQLPAMVFLVSDAIGVKKGFMTWAQVKEMEASGVLAGAHTRTHQYLPRLTREQAIDQIAGSKRVIEEQLGHPIFHMVYPSGGFNDDVKLLVKEAGYKAAATTNRGRDKLNRDLFELNRIRMKDSDSGLALWAKLSGYYNVFRGTKMINIEEAYLK